MYSPACEVWSEENVRVKMTVVAFLNVSVTVVSSSVVTGPEDVIQ